MKKKSILPLVTVTMLATALLGGCANKTDSTTSFSDYAVTPVSYTHLTLPTNREV